MTSGSLRPTFAFALVAASVVLLSGCFAAPVEQPRAETSEAPAPAPQSTPTDLVLPDVATGELARVSFLQSGPDGVPTSQSEISDAPTADATYLLEAECSPLAEPVETGYTVVTADDEAREVTAGTFTCDGTAIANSAVLGTDAPVQISFTSTDGVWQAYARLVPEA